MKKKGLALSLIFILLIGSFTLGYIFVPQKSFSQNENRSLQTFPTLTPKGVLSGDVQAKLNTYTSDQVMLRNSLISLKTAVQRTLGRKDIGGVYICSDGYYIEKYTNDDIPKDTYENNLNTIKKFFDTYKNKITGKCSVAIVPDAGLILSDKLPKNASVYDEEKIINRVYSVSGGTSVDLVTPLKAVKDSAFYKTDHHWTASGAFAAYKAYCNALSKPIYDEYKKETASTDFKGTLYSKIIDPFSKTDTIEFYRYDGDENYKVTADGKTLSGIYDRSYLKKKDKYSAFLGGNHAKVTVSGGSGSGNLLIIRDSYSSSMLPMLMKNYSSITLVDTRYFRGSLGEAIKSEKITDISVILSAKDFVSDPTFGMVLY